MRGSYTKLHFKTGLLSFYMVRTVIKSMSNVMLVQMFIFVLLRQTYRFAVKAGCADRVCDVTRRRHRPSLDSSSLTTHRQHILYKLQSQRLNKKDHDMHGEFHITNGYDSCFREQNVLRDLDGLFIVSGQNEGLVVVGVNLHICVFFNVKNVISSY